MDIKEAFEGSGYSSWLETLTQYQQQGGDLNAHHPDSGWTLLHLAVEMERSDVIRWLVDHGADVNATTTEGWTPLHHAVDIDLDGAIQMGAMITLATTTLLIQLGADESVVDKRLGTPRDIAAAYGHTDKYDAIDR